MDEIRKWTADAHIFYNRTDEREIERCKENWHGAHVKWFLLFIRAWLQTPVLNVRNRDDLPLSFIHQHQRLLCTVLSAWQLWTHWQFVSSAHKGTKPISAASKEPSGSRTANHVSSRLPLVPRCLVSEYVRASIPHSFLYLLNVGVEGHCRERLTYQEHIKVPQVL